MSPRPSLNWNQLRIAHAEQEVPEDGDLRVGGLRLLEQRHAVGSLLYKRYISTSIDKVPPARDEGGRNA